MTTKVVYTYRFRIKTRNNSKFISLTNGQGRMYFSPEI